MAAAGRLFEADAGAGFASTRQGEGGQEGIVSRVDTRAGTAIALSHGLAEERDQ
jgi:hypothetical protein